MLCREKKPRVGAGAAVVGTHAANGAGVKGLLHNRNVRFTDLKRLAEESEDAVVGGGPRDGAAKLNGGAAKGVKQPERPEQHEQEVEEEEEEADGTKRSVVVTFEQGEPCNVTDDEDDDDDDGTSVASQDGTKPATGREDADAFKMADPVDPDTGCCMQCAYVTVEFCGCSIM